MLHLRHIVLAIAVAVVAPFTPPWVASSAAEPSSMTCTVPAPGEAPERTEATAVGLDPARLRAALAYADTHMRTSVRVFRNNCLVGEGALNPLTQNVPANVFSATKAVASLLAGIAIDDDALGLDDPIGAYLPNGWGDAAHRAITVRQLLTQTSGLDEAVLAELATAGTEANVVRAALAQPITHEPGTYFRYSQRTPDLLAFVVQQAVGEDLQAFAQRRLFGPIGIKRSDYIWLRDRSGNTYGYAHLFIPPAQFARLGLLLQNGGHWDGERIVSSSYLQQASTPTATNGCYGFLFWTNGGTSCTGANLPSAQTIDGPMVASAPGDMYAMVGAFQQNNFVIPSLNMTVSWTGLGGDSTLNNLAGLASAHPSASSLYHEFFRLLMRAVQDVDVPDPGPLEAPDNFDADPLNYLSPHVLLRDLAPDSQCNLLVCDGVVPTEGVLANVGAVLSFR